MIEAKSVPEYIKSHKLSLASLGLAAIMGYGSIVQLGKGITSVDEKGLGWRMHLATGEDEWVFSLRLRQKGANYARCGDSNDWRFTVFEQVNDEISIGRGGLRERFYRSRQYPDKVGDCKTSWD